VPVHSFLSTTPVSAVCRTRSKILIKQCPATWCIHI